MIRKRHTVFLAVAIASACSCTPFIVLQPDGGDGPAGSGGRDDVSNGGSGDAGGSVQDSAAGMPGDASEDSRDASPMGSDSSSDSGGLERPFDVPVELAPEVPQAFCGDGVPTPPEECDLGTTANTGAYGKCTKDCKLAPRCGDGKLNDVSEVCDNGADNGFGLGNCNPICSSFVTEKHIRVAKDFPTNGAIGGIEDADLICEQYVGSTYRALLVDGVNRIASKTPFRADGQLSWVLLPYTRYLNEFGNLIWTTDEVALLGVRNAQQAAILNPISPGLHSLVWAGYQSDWTTSPGTCESWQSQSQQADSGSVLSLDTSTIDSSGAACSQSFLLLCVERY